MAMSGTRWGDAVAAAVQGQGIVAGTPITTGQLQNIWRAICAQHDGEISANADINLDQGDIDTSPSDIPSVNRTLTGKID